MAQQYGPHIVTDELVLCYDAADKVSNSGGGTTWSDLSGNNNNGTLSHSSIGFPVNRGFTLQYLINNTTEDAMMISGTSSTDLTNGEVLLIESEQVKVGAFTNYFAGYARFLITRGYNGTTAAAHAAGTALKTAGDYMVFNGSNNYVNTGDTFQSTFRSSFSIEFWAKADDGQPSEERQFGGEVTSGNEIQLALQHSSQIGKLYFGYYAGGDSSYGRTSSAVFSDGATDWFHVVFIANDTTEQMSIYFNGATQSLTSGDLSGVTMGDFTTSNNFYVGALNNVGSLIYEWDGNIAITRIYEKALSTPEISQNFNAQRARFGV